MRFLLGYGSCGIASGADFVFEGLNEVLKDSEYSVEKVVEILNSIKEQEAQK